MAISTLYGHVSRALSFFDKSALYFGIGRTTEWVDEQQPPAPSTDMEFIEEAVAYKKAMEKRLVVPDPQGTIFYQGDYYREVQAADARAEKCRWVYVSTTLVGDELPLTSYRQIGFYSELELETGVPTNQLVLLPSDVADPGLLEVVDNRKVTHRQSDQSEKLSFIIEF